VQALDHALLVRRQVGTATVQDNAVSSSSSSGDSNALDDNAARDL